MDRGRVTLLPDFPHGEGKTRENQCYLETKAILGEACSCGRVFSAHTIRQEHERTDWLVSSWAQYIPAVMVENRVRVCSRDFEKVKYCHSIRRASGAHPVAAHLSSYKRENLGDNSLIRLLVLKHNYI